MFAETPTAAVTAVLPTPTLGVTDGPANADVTALSVGGTMADGLSRNLP